MDFIPLSIIVMLFGYILYKDISFSKERASLQLKLMSKDVNEYVAAVNSLEDTDESEEEEEIYVPIEELSVEDILKAKDL